LFIIPEEMNKVKPLPDGWGLCAIPAQARGVLLAQEQVHHHLLDELGQEGRRHAA